MKSIHIQHLYNRIGFGILPSQLEELSSRDRETIVDALFVNSKIMTPLKADTSFYDGVTKEDLKDRTKRRELQKISRQKVKEYNFSWFNRLANPTELLREKMTLFWANHFVCQSRSIIFVEQYNNALRKNALGNFGNFTKTIAKEAAMLNYLNNKQNRKKSPNENFARELMELFTLGQGNYTEKDIQESARAFTGYFHDNKGEFKMLKSHHDEREKTFFGKSGNFSGDDIIDIILEQEQCAQFICEKIYQYFVNDTLDKRNVGKMVEVFYDNYDIENLMRFVFTSNWFYDDENIGNKIKSPIEFLIGMNTVVPYQIKQGNKAMMLQKLLGQILLEPPNVAGWKTGKYWIDSNTIVRRLRLPSVLLNKAQITFSEKGDEETMLKNFNKKKLRRKAFIKAEIDWNSFDATYGKLSTEELVAQLLSPKINKGMKAVLLGKQNVSKRDFCIQLMSLPEYQLC